MNQEVPLHIKPGVPILNQEVPLHIEAGVQIGGPDGPA